jgi:hypothetical protein
MVRTQECRPAPICRFDLNTRLTGAAKPPQVLGVCAQAMRRIQRESARRTRGIQAEYKRNTSEMRADYKRAPPMHLASNRLAGGLHHALTWLSHGSPLRILSPPLPHNSESRSFVAQASKPAVSPTSQSACRFHKVSGSLRLRAGKLAIRQIRKYALRLEQRRC